MKTTAYKKALKAYQKFAGNFKTSSMMPLKKESDLEYMYYPGIDAVLEKIEDKEEYQKKSCRLHKTIGLISTKSTKHYPLLTARAALLSHLADVNVIPLMIKYEHVKNLPSIISSLTPNFKAIYCTDMSSIEKAVLKGSRKISTPILFHDESLATSAAASILNAAKMLRKTIKKVAITIEGIDAVTTTLIDQLVGEKAANITLLDKKGPLYMRRPNMNRDKNNAVKMLKLRKDERTYGEVMAATDIYINALKDDLTDKTSNQLPDKAVIVCLKAKNISKKPKQTIVSTLPTQPNHITDLHLVAGIAYALSEGKKFTEKSIAQITKGLASVYKSPKAIRLIPGLLEKNLVKKISKAMK